VDLMAKLLPGRGTGQEKGGGELLRRSSPGGDRYRVTARGLTLDLREPILPVAHEPRAHVSVALSASER
jgi:hypothetical protein